MKERRTILIVVAVVIVAVFATYYLFLAERERQIAIQEASTAPLDIDTTVLEDSSSGEQTITLYSYNPGAVSPADSSFLRATEISVFQVEDQTLMARQIIAELFKLDSVDEPDGNGEEMIALRTFPERARIRQLYILDDGTAIVDLSLETAQGIIGGITAELAVIHSITRSLRENLPGVQGVRFLVEGQEQETLAGHVSIKDPFR
jgi:hypothetical protein